MNKPEQSAQQQLAALFLRHGENTVKQYVKDFQEHAEDVRELSKLLSEFHEESESLEYQQLIQNIIAATQRYYIFIGTLPEDVRTFILNLSDTDSKENAAVFTHLGLNPQSSLIPRVTAQAIRPKNYIMQVDAITNQLARLDGQTQLRVGGGSSQPVLTTVTLDMPDHMRIEGGHALSTYDKSILNGVTSLIESGNTFFSVPMLYHAMTGRKNPTIDDTLYDEIVEKLEKMRRMMLTIDLTEENEAHYITGKDGNKLEITDLTLEGYLLPLNKASGNVNGKKTDLYQIIQYPPLYTYSKMRKQLASVRISLLGAPVNNNSTTIPLKTYLLQRIELIKNERNNITRSSILYESIYQELGAGEASKTKKMRIRSYTTTILDYFITQNYIKEYSEYKKGRSVSGVFIVI